MAVTCLSAGALKAVSALRLLFDLRAVNAKPARGAVESLRSTVPGNNSFGPTRRIKKRQDFLRIQASRKKSRSDHLLLAVTKSENEFKKGRIGITVTTKVDKRAARRNYLKRCIREFYRKESERFTQTVDLVVIALDGATELKYRQVASEMRYALKRLGLLGGR